jgi:hypothetical protein
MKLSRIIGLALMAMLLASMVGAGSASAAVFERCAKNASTTKYTTNECNVASSTGTFGWEEVKNTEAAVALGTLKLADTNVPFVGTVEVSCTGEGTGSAGPGKFSRIEKITNITCSAGENCEKVTKNAEPRNLPWQGELAEEGTTEKLRNKITNGKTEKEAPGWAVTCRVALIEKTDICTITTGSAQVGIRLVYNPAANQSSWMILLTFNENSPNANCELGGTGSGRVRGSLLLLISAGNGLLAR